VIITGDDPRAVEAARKMMEDMLVVLDDEKNLHCWLLPAWSHHGGVKESRTATRTRAGRKDTRACSRASRCSTPKRFGLLIHSNDGARAQACTAI